MGDGGGSGYSLRSRQGTDFSLQWPSRALQGLVDHSPHTKSTPPRGAFFRVFSRSFRGFCVEHQFAARRAPGALGAPSADRLVASGLSVCCSSHSPGWLPAALRQTERSQAPSKRRTGSEEVEPGLAAKRKFPHHKLTAVGTCSVRKVTTSPSWPPT